MLGISWKNRMTNEFVQRGIKARAGQQENLLGIVKRRKLAWFDHISRHNSLAKTVLQGTLEGGRKRGRQVKCWADNLKEWPILDSPTLTRLAEDRPAWRSLSYDVSTMSPLWLQVKGLSEWVRVISIRWGINLQAGRSKDVLETLRLHCFNVS